MRFLEQVTDDRIVISDVIVARADVEGDRVIRDIDAACWIEAKQNFGYPLTGVQDWLLGEFYAKRDRL